MKTNFVKSIIAVMVAFVTVSASAQRVVTGIDTRNPQACGEYLVKNPKDTIVSVDALNMNGMYGVVRRSVYMRGNSFVAWNDTVFSGTVHKTVADTARLEALEKVSEEALTAEKLSNGNPRDYKFGHSKELEDYVKGKGFDYPDAGKIPVKVADKYGFGIRLHAGYAFSDGANGMVGGVGLTYGREYWDVSLLGEVGRSKYSYNAVKAGESYMTYRGEATVAVRPFKLDVNDVNRVSVFAGAGVEYGETGSKAYTSPSSGKVEYISSKGGYLYPTVGVKFDHRIFSTGNSFGFSVQYLWTQAVVQSSDAQRIGAIVAKASFSFGIHRNKVSLK